MNAWYVVHTHARGERKAFCHLERQGFDAYLPCYAKQRRHARKIETVPAPLFPRYLFVRLDPESCRWRAIRSTVGVSHLVCRGDAPAPVPDGIVDAIREREDGTGLVQLASRIPFAKGQSLRFVSGAFVDHIGLFEGLSENERVVVLLSLLGRDVRISAPIDAVAAA